MSHRRDSLGSPDRYRRRRCSPRPRERRIVRRPFTTRPRRRNPRASRWYVPRWRPSRQGTHRTKRAALCVVLRARNQPGFVKPSTQQQERRARLHPACRPTSSTIVATYGFEKSADLAQRARIFEQHERRTRQRLRHAPIHTNDKGNGGCSPEKLVS